MRLVCPNCEAKYEVPEDAIPETGRDVQCANCGHAWYQMRPRAGVPDAVTAPAPVAPPVAEVAPEPEPDIAPAAEMEAPVETVAEAPVVAEEIAPESVVAAEPLAEAVVTEAVAESEAAVVETATVEAEVAAGEVEPALAVVEPEGAVAETGAVAGEDEPEAEAPVVAAAPVAYAVDDSVLAILREEAERETQARRAEAAKPLETQTDLGIESVIPDTRKPVEVIPAAEPVIDVDGDDRLATRRTRLPDVEEINSTLRPTETALEGAGAEALPVAAEARSSFRSGFLMVLTVAILGSAVYGAADALAEAVPALAGPLKAYVGFVDSLRLHLDGLMQSATVAINGD